MPNPHHTITSGQTVSPRVWTTLRGTSLTVPVGDELTHIQFRRFAGCPVCNLHLRSFIARRAEIAEAGVHEVVLFHSSAADLRKHETDLPFDVIPDPEKRLYREFGVESAKRALLSPKAWWPIVHAVLRSSLRLLRRQRPLPPLNPGGGRFGLPADFLIDRDGTVIGSHYGTHAYDQWSVDEVLERATSASAAPSRPRKV